MAPNCDYKMPSISPENARSTLPQKSSLKDIAKMQVFGKLFVILVASSGVLAGVLPGLGGGEWNLVCTSS